MLKLTIKKPVRLPEDIEFSGPQVQRLADVVQQGQLTRLAAGLDANDQPMKPLSNDYRQRKLNKGQRGIRDWRRQGRTLRALQVLEADSDGFMVGFAEDPEAKKRAWFRQLFDNGFGFSPQNAVAFDAELEDVFTELYTDLLREAA